MGEGKEDKVITRLREDLVEEEEEEEEELEEKK